MPYPLTTTLARIKAANPCPDGWARALAAAGKAEADEDLILFSEIINAVEIEDALWCCRAEPQHSREWRLFGVWCARQAQHLTTDQRSLDALDIAERYANGLATDKDLDAASCVAWRAVWDVQRDAVRDAQRDAAWCAASCAALDAVWDVAWRAVWDAQRDDARDAQRNAFMQLCTDGTLPTN